MKTAVSIPDDVFKQADLLAGQLGWNRSQLFTQALIDFLQQQGLDPVTTALDALADETPASPSNHGRSLIDSGGWEW